MTRLAALIALLLTAPAAAAPWVNNGGDPGRSGYQPAGDGTPPVELLWTAGGEDVVTAPLITAADRIAYGTADGRVRLRELVSGAPAGPEAGVALGTQPVPATFGDPAIGLAETGGRIYAVHSADDADPIVGDPAADVEIAVVDADNGALVQDAVVPGTAGHRVGGPVVAAAGALLFLTVKEGGPVTLWRVGLEAGLVGRPESVAVPAADLRGGLSVANLPAPHVVVATAGALRTFSLAAFPAAGPDGPSSSTSAVSAPVPGPGEDSSLPAPALYQLADRVLRLEPRAGAIEPAAAGDPLAGAPAPGLAVAQELISGGLAPGWIVAGTGEGLHVLDARTLKTTGRLPGAFTTSMPAAAGRLAFAARDDGAPVALDLAAARALAMPAGLGGRPAAQPALARGVVLFASGLGLTAYRTRCGNTLAGTRGDDRLAGGALGDAIAGFAGADQLSGGAAADCLEGGTGRDELRGDDGDDTLSGATGRDRLEGGAGDDELLGGDGRDILLGGEGDDRLAGGRATDRIDAGGGADRVNARGGGRDRVRCGAGRDTVLADRGDRILRDCERTLRR